MPMWSAECTHQSRKNWTPSLSAESLASEQHEKKEVFSDPNRNVELSYNVKLSRGKVPFYGAISCGSYNMCFNAVLHFVDGDTECFRCFGFAQHSTAHDKGDFVSQALSDAVL